MKINIPTPCHENWNNMTPDEKGRFCSVCSKTVRDFRKASDQEIVDVFSGSSKNICGNFNETQLGRDLRYSFVNALFMKFAVGFMLTAGGFVSLEAQQKDLPAQLAGLSGKAFAPVVKDSLFSRRMIGGASMSLQNHQEPLCLLNGKVSSLEELRKIDPDMIKRMKVLDKNKASAMFSNEKAKNGVILVTTKKRKFRK
ncbi:hypothetical protein [Chryseobacterium sp. 2987]|uniref:hypothetical protein n=1 Tax=Chryseobacterium sp. 2987 TaxID=2817767 RepID=UPI002863150D|nr:hypothetical protein [Chryseobacterium sp. 2987]MDR6920110.1 hypothetical protein [Chryseobacterium sp. 2987]